MVVKSKLDMNLPRDEVQKKGQRLFNTYPGRKKQEAGILSHTVQGFNSLPPQGCNAVNLEFCIHFSYISSPTKSWHAGNCSEKCNKNHTEAGLI